MRWFPGCLPHRQLWVSNLFKDATQWLEVDLNLRPSGCKAQNIPLHHRIPLINIQQPEYISSSVSIAISTASFFNCEEYASTVTLLHENYHGSFNMEFTVLHYNHMERLPNVINLQNSQRAVLPSGKYQTHNHSAPFS